MPENRRNQRASLAACSDHRPGRPPARAASASPGGVTEVGLSARCARRARPAFGGVASSQNDGTAANAAGRCRTTHRIPAVVYTATRTGTCRRAASCRNLPADGDLAVASAVTLRVHDPGRPGTANDDPPPPAPAARIAGAASAAAASEVAATSSAAGCPTCRAGSARAAGAGSPGLTIVARAQGVRPPDPPATACHRHRRSRSGLRGCQRRRHPLCPLLRRRAAVKAPPPPPPATSTRFDSASPPRRMSDAPPPPPPKLPVPPAPPPLKPPTPPSRIRSALASDEDIQGLTRDDGQRRCHASSQAASGTPQSLLVRPARSPSASSRPAAL